MARFLIRRLLHAALTLAGIAVLVFFGLRVTGDPTLLMAPEGATLDQIDLLRRQLGFDRPYLWQFVDHLWGLARLDFGTSVVQRLPAGSIVLARLPYTLSLAGAAFGLALCGGLVLGILAASRRSRVSGLMARAVILAGQSLPTFLSGTLLILLFAIVLNWLPSSGADAPGALILPALVLGAYSMAVLARLVQAGLSEELGKDYIRACRSRGLGRGRILLHALRNAAPALLAMAALEGGNLFAGTVIVETVFAWPGLGHLLLQSVQARDFPVTQAVVLMVAGVYVAANLLADLAHAALDPRLRARLS